MTEPFVGEIRMFAGNFAPRGYALCDGQLLAVSQNDALFAVLGTIYGGDGMTTFGLPEMRGRIPIHYGSGPGLTPRLLGTRLGDESVTLTAGQIPSHSHTLNARNTTAGTQVPQNNLLGVPPTSIYAPQDADEDMATDAIAQTGSNQAHPNLMPSLCIHFIIALSGIFPSQF